MASKNKDKVVVKDVNADETHMQMFRRLGGEGGFVFAHGTPQTKVKKSH